MKKLIFVVCALAVAFLGYNLFIREDENTSPADTTNIATSTVEDNEIFLDLDGDGEKEHVVLGIPEDESKLDLDFITAYDSAGNEIASLPLGIRIKVPILVTGATKIHKLDSNSNRESFSLDFTAGPHQAETMFFEMRDNAVFPLCHEENPTGAYDCLFYSGNIGYLPIEDLDKDGYVELIEIVDEYSGSGELSPKEENAIDQSFDEQSENAKIIAKREKGGRGRAVVWAIYSFDGRRFVEQTGDDYERFYFLIGDLVKDKMRKSEMSKESLEYTQLVRGFWSPGAK